MLKQKNIWDVVDNTRQNAVTVAQIKKKNKNNIIAIIIIKKGVKNDLYINVISEQDLYRSWKTLQQIYSQIG